MTDQATRNRIAKIRESFGAEVERVRADRYLSSEGKRQRIARSYLRQRAEIDGIRAALEKGKVERRARLESDLFSIESVVGRWADPATRAAAAVSQRDAQDRVAAVVKAAGSNPDDIRAALTNLLARAERSGDEFMARAVAEAGFTHRQPDVLNAFSEARPRFEDAVDELWEQESTRPVDVMATEFLYTLEAPAEIAGRLPEDIERIAETDAPEARVGA